MKKHSEHTKYDITSCETDVHEIFISARTCAFEHTHKIKYDTHSKLGNGSSWQRWIGVQSPKDQIKKQNKNPRIGSRLHMFAFFSNINHQCHEIQSRLINVHQSQCQIGWTNKCIWNQQPAREATCAQQHYLLKWVDFCPNTGNDLVCLPCLTAKR